MQFIYVDLCLFVKKFRFGGFLYLFYYVLLLFIDLFLFMLIYIIIIIFFDDFVFGEVMFDNFY